MLRAEWLRALKDPGQPDAKAIFRSLKHNWPQMRHDFLVWAKAEKRENRDADRLLKTSQEVAS